MTIYWFVPALLCYTQAQKAEQWSVQCKRWSSNSPENYKTLNYSMRKAMYHALLKTFPKLYLSQMTLFIPPRGTRHPRITCKVQHQYAFYFFIPQGMEFSTQKHGYLFWLITVVFRALTSSCGWINSTFWILSLPTLQVDIQARSKFFM